MKIKDLNQNADFIEYLECFAKYLKGFLLLSGKNGTGKTFAALAVYYKIVPFKLPAHDWDRAIFITQTELNLKWSQHISQYGQTVYLLQEICKPPLLILDDIGTSTPSGAFMDFLYAIADKRYFEKDIKATIITTNLTASEMRSRFSDAFVSRVASGKCFRLEGVDRRFKVSSLPSDQL